MVPPHKLAEQGIGASGRRLGLAFDRELLNFRQQAVDGVAGGAHPSVIIMQKRARFAAPKRGWFMRAGT